jgi:hypothetical protein
MQLQHAYICTFALRVNHRSILLASRRATTNRSSWARTAEDSAAEYMFACRRALCESNWCTPAQTAALQKLYDEAHEHYNRLVCEQATADAEQALEAHSTHAYVNGLLCIARDAAQHLTTYVPSLDLTRRWDTIGEVNRDSLTPQVADCHEVARWRLECLPRCVNAGIADVEWARQHLCPVTK